MWIAKYRQEIRDRDQLSSMNAMKKKGLAEGRAEGRAEAKTESAKNALAMGLSISQAAQISGLSEEEVSKLK